jgi:16S rRNA (cytosine1407-C5)-methyltransferase
MGKKIYSQEFLKSLIKPNYKERYIEMLGEEEFNKFVNIITTPQRKSIRINSLKVKNPEQIAQNIKKKGVFLEKINFVDNAYFVNHEKSERVDLGNLFEHQLGLIYVQEATSMTPPLVLEIPEKINNDFKVLDMAAAPGSKTTQLGEYMKNKGILIANEIDYSRLGALKTNLERVGLTNVIITNADGRNIRGNEIFDRILLDAPCSGTGVIRKSPKTLKTYNPKTIKSITKLQIKLLQRAFELLKKGGIMTYSTCSLEPEEDEFLIEKFLENNPNAKLEKVEIKGLENPLKLKEFKGKKIKEEILEKTLRIWPHIYDTNGFFLAKIKKEK